MSAETHCENTFGARVGEWGGSGSAVAGGSGALMGHMVGGWIWADTAGGWAFPNNIVENTRPRVYSVLFVGT